MSESSWNAQRLSTSPAIVASSSLPGSPSQAGLSRRLSWSRSDSVDLQGPPRMAQADEHTYPPNLNHPGDFDNPFEDGEEERERANRATYNLQQPSQTSLVADFHNSSALADDEQRLTSSAQPFWGAGDATFDEDEERRAGNAIKGRRQRYGGAPSRSTTLGGSALRAVSRNLRRVSIRVVDLASSSSRDQGVKLDGIGDDDQEEEKPSMTLEEPLPETLPSKLRGNSLGLFGTRSRVRNAMYSLLLSP